MQPNPWNYWSHLCFNSWIIISRDEKEKGEKAGEGYYGFGAEKECCALAKELSEKGVSGS